MSKQKNGDIKLLCSNRRASFEYTIIDTYEAGIVLYGSEVKSLRNGHGNLLDSYVSVDKKNAVLWNFNISIYKNTPDDKKHDPSRTKLLLLHSHQISKLRGLVTKSGLTIIPTKVYINKTGFIKVEIGLARGKKLHDKRRDLKEKDLAREKRRNRDHFHE